MNVIDINHGTNSGSPGIQPSVSGDLAHIVSKSAKVQLPTSMIPVNTDFVLSQGGNLINNFGIGPGDNTFSNYLNQGSNGRGQATVLTRKERKNETQNLKDTTQSIYESNKNDKYFAKVLEHLGFKAGNLKNITRIEIRESGDVILYSKDGKAQTTTITDRKLSRLKGLMQPVSTSLPDYNQTVQAQCPPAKTYSVEHSARGVVSALYADIYDSNGNKVRTQQIVVDPKGVRAMSALVLAEGETAQLYGKIFVPVAGKDGKVTYNKVEGNIGLNLPKGTGNLDNILDSDEARTILNQRVSDVVARARATIIGYDLNNCQIASLLQEIIVVPKERQDISKILIELQNQLAEYSRLGDERFEQCLINYAGIMDKLNSIEKQLETKPTIEQKLESKKEAPAVITPSKTSFELDLNYSNPNSLEANLRAALINGRNARLILGLSGGYGLKEESLGPQRAQDHSWYSDKYDQTLRSTTDLMGSYTPKQIAALFQLEFGRQNGFRAGIEGRAGVEFRNLGLSLAKEIKCLDNGNTIEYSVLDLGKADYHAFFTEALGYVKVPVSRHIDLYVAGGARNSPRIFVDKINGQAIITNVGPENGVELYKGGIKPVAKAGLNFRF